MSNKLINQVNYAVYSPNGTKLDLSICDEVGIKVDIPIKENTNIDITVIAELTEEGVDIFNKSDSFFNDICIPYNSDNSAGLPFNMRKNLYVNSSLCNTGCTLNSINPQTRKVSCSCNTKSTTPISQVGDGFKETILNSNFFVIKCFDLVLNFDKFKNNIGSFCFIGLIWLQIMNLIYYSITTIRPIQIMVNDKIQNNKHPNPPKKLYRLDNQRAYQIDSMNKSNTSDKLSTKELFTIPVCIKTQFNKDDKTLSLKSDRVSEKEKKPSLFLLGKNEGNGVDKNISLINEINVSLNISHNDLSHEEKEINEVIYQPTHSKIVYTPNELNNLPYNLAIENDLRNFKSLYWEFLKYKQPILNAFVLDTDVNLKTVKIAMFFFSIAMEISFNAIFFTEEIQTKNYESNGDLNFLITLPKVMISFVVSVILSTILSLISSFESQFSKLTQQNQSPKQDQEIDKFYVNTKCKLIVSLLLYLS